MLFNQNMNDYNKNLQFQNHQPMRVQLFLQNHHNNDNNDRLLKVVNDIEELHGEPVFFVKEMALHLFQSRVFPTPQHLSYTAASILYYIFDPRSLQQYLSSKTLSVKLYKRCVYCNYTYFLPFALRLCQMQKVQLLFSYIEKKSSYILATNRTGFSHGPFPSVGITGSD